MAVVEDVVVIDASVALAFLRKERSGEAALPFLMSGVMSAVNYAEVAQRFWRDGQDARPLLDELDRTGLIVVPAERAVALIAGELALQSKDLSLADRFCLAEAINRNLPILTADRPWRNLALPVEVKFLR